MTTNELMLAKAFRDAGFEQEKAESLAQSIFDAIRDNVATKSDLQRVEQALKSDLQAMDARIDTRFAKIEGEMTLLKWMIGGVYVIGVPALWLLLRVATKIGALG